MAVLTWIMVGLSSLVLAAHFLRSELTVLVGVCLAMPLLLLVNSSKARHVLTALLVIGALEWARTALGIMIRRLDTGEPYTRMLVIMGGVAAFTLLSAVVSEIAFRRRRRALPEDGRSSESAEQQDVNRPPQASRA